MRLCSFAEHSLPGALSALALALTLSCGVASPIVTGIANLPTDADGGAGDGQGATPEGEPNDNVPAATGNQNQSYLGTSLGGHLVLTPELSQGSYWVDGMANRSNIMTDPNTGVAQAGMPLILTLTVLDAASGSLEPWAGAQVDIWHANALGAYSDSASFNTLSQAWLRGYQITDSSGQVTFQTIVPGWTPSHATKIHLRIRSASPAFNFTAQGFFPDALVADVDTTAPYQSNGSADTTTATDVDFQSACGQGGISFTCGSLMTIGTTIDGNGHALGTLQLVVDSSQP